MKVGVVKEAAPGERRVALTPDVVTALRDSDVLVEAGAGESAGFPDSAYEEAGATVVPRDDLYESADVVVCVNPPAPDCTRSGQVLVGLLRPAERPERVREWARRGVTAVSLDLLPRTLPRA